MKVVENTIRIPKPGEWVKLDGWQKYYKVHTSTPEYISFCVHPQQRYSHHVHGTHWEWRNNESS